MTKHEAKRLQEALHNIERGKVDFGVTQIRDLLHEAGWPAPSLVIEAMTRPPKGRER